MSVRAHRFFIGNYHAMVVIDGDGIFSPQISCLYVDTGSNKVLIDTGFGEGINGPSQSYGNLVDNLRKEGIKPSDIDTVIHSHAHGDHVGGNFDSGGRRVFPNAGHVLHAKDWEYIINKFAATPDDGSENSQFTRFIARHLLPLKGEIELAADGPDIVPGIKYILAPGHTPGNCIVQISSGGERLLYIGDMIHTPEEFLQPDLFARIDSNHELAKSTRNRFLLEIAESRTKVFAGHFPFPGLGYIEKKDTVFTWRPI